MPKPHTFPTLYDEVHFISITKLKEWGYLNPDQIRQGSVNWSRNGNSTGSINILVDTYEMTVRLRYTYRKEIDVDYVVKMVKVPSNLGKGELIYFVCPHTNKRGRKLYSIGRDFLHREAYKGCMYDCQITPKSVRWLKPWYQGDKLYEQLYKKNFKKFYAGKPTKKYLSLMKKIRKAESISLEQIENAIIRR